MSCTQQKYPKAVVIIPDVTDRNGRVGYLYAFCEDKEINYKAGDDVKQSRLKSPPMACHSINKPLPDAGAHKPV